MATGLERIAATARGEPKLRFTSLAHHITAERVWSNLSQMSANARRFARPDAAAKIVRSLERWSAGRKAARALGGTNGGEAH